MKRRFTKKERLYLGILSGWRCEICGNPLSVDLHADHRMPFSKGGKTELRNAQALCAKCNLEKGEKYGK